MHTFGDRKDKKGNKQTGDPGEKDKLHQPLSFASRLP